MADSLKASFDTSQWDAVFAKLVGPAGESLARRMCVSGGVILRDEAKMLALRPTTHVYNPNSRGSQEAGTLSNAIYLAFRKEDSTPTNFKYSVTWNEKKAFWGKFREFGYHITHVVYQTKDGVFHTDMTRLLKTPIHVAANPFLRPAFDANLSRVKAAMIERGRAEIKNLLQE